MSWTRPEKILILTVSLLLFVVVNFAAHILIKNILNVSIYDSNYEITQIEFIKKLSGKRVHPFYGLSDGTVPGFNSKVSAENNFRSVSPTMSNKPIAVLVVGGSVASHLSEAREDIIEDHLFADKLNKSFNTDRFVVYNASFGGGKQPQQYFKILYLDLLGFSPDIIINYDGFNEVALSIGENFQNNLNAIYPRNFYESLGASVYDGACFSTNNWLLSFNTYIPFIELVKWVYVRNCHNEAVWSEVSINMNNKMLTEIEQKDFINRVKLVWSHSSNKTFDFAKARKIPYIHVLQPNRHLAGSKPLTDEEVFGDSAKRKPIAPALLASTQEYYGTLNMDLLSAPYKIDQRYLFEEEQRTVYIDKCCHFNKLGMTTIIEDIISKAEPAFKKLLSE